MNNTSLFYSGWILIYSEFYSLTTSDDLFNELKRETDGFSSLLSAGVKEKQTKAPTHHPLCSFSTFWVKGCKITSSLRTRLPIEETCNPKNPEATRLRGQEEEEQVEDEDQLAWKV